MRLAVLCCLLALVLHLFLSPVFSWFGGGKTALVLLELVCFLMPSCLAFAWSGVPAALLGWKPGMLRLMGLSLLTGASASLLLSLLGDWVERILPPAEEMIRQRESLYACLQARSGIGWLTALLVGAVIPGICEEALFRATLFQGLAGILRQRWVLLLSAFLFASAHMDPWRFPSLFLLGLLFGWTFLKTGNLWIAAACHAGCNATGIVLLNVAPDFTQTPWAIPLGLVAALTCLLCLVAFSHR
jgi:membrane protease YdiL (CAAX protease family)